MIEFIVMSNKSNVEVSTFIELTDSIALEFDIGYDSNKLYWLNDIGSVFLYWSWVFSYFIYTIPTYNPETLSIAGHDCPFILILMSNSSKKGKYFICCIVNNGNNSFKTNY